MQEVNGDGGAQPRTERSSALPPRATKIERTAKRTLGVSGTEGKLIGRLQTLWEERSLADFQMSRGPTSRGTRAEESFRQGA